ncbi:hypothetical protein RHMOL_Rhmol01G0016000 [Rhododendron molle]|uniref:Uncharacterized protein n=1 Tax=Rhododendron molle TaxID=49168 RepID=A0ACC0PYI4_RHOML|nr:hypothetical protein RHMOL_Rhmol01G0016000 [Rhododendron molle]
MRLRRTKCVPSASSTDQMRLRRSSSAPPGRILHKSYAPQALKVLPRRMLHRSCAPQARPPQIKCNSGFIDGAWILEGLKPGAAWIVKDAAGVNVHEGTCGFVAHSALQAEYRSC